MVVLAPGLDLFVHAGPAGPTTATSAPATSPPAAAAPPATDLSLFLGANRPAYSNAMRRARAWLDALHVDPADLRTRGIKGKKKLVEQLEAYYRLWRVAAAAEKGPLLERIKGVVGLTYEDRYHDMGSISDEWFRQDSTSYLRAAYLMDRLGLDTRRYRREIAKIQPRLDAQMSQRGPNQQDAFHLYYQHFGLEEPFPLAAAQQKGLIASHKDPAGLSTSDLYDLTHEVYAPYDYGDRLDVDPFSVPDKAYLRSAFASLASRYLGQHAIDPLSEIVECLHYLRLQDEPGYRAGISFLLGSQNRDGSWGTYDRERMRLGDYVRQGYQLHTTLVAILALTAVFEEPMPGPTHRDSRRTPGTGGGTGSPN
jgi:hypothetical protein